jgi:hypothetical protein
MGVLHPIDFYRYSLVVEGVFTGNNMGTDLFQEYYANYVSKLSNFMECCNVQVQSTDDGWELNQQQYMPIKITLDNNKKGLSDAAR